MMGLYHLLLAWMPSGLALVAFGLIALLVVFIIFRIMKIVLDALPFL